MYKNIAKQEKLLLKNLVDYQPGQVVSKTLVQNELMSVTVFSFEKDEEISTHASGGDAMVTVLEGTGRFTVGGEELTTYTTAYGLEGTEMVSDGYFHESEVRSAPYFDIIIDGINAVVEE